MRFRRSSCETWYRQNVRGRTNHRHSLRIVPGPSPPSQVPLSAHGPSVGPVWDRVVDELLSGVARQGDGTTLR